MKGLLGRCGLADTEALVLPNCHSVHTIGMRFAIDVVFVDRSFRIVKIYEAVCPGKLLPPAWFAWGAVEFSSGAVVRLGLKSGEQLELVK